ncbi:hypothetical protein [Nonomuraea basaltis]|uniref:hypothetical protein n=1 Tax=Nonomuraea basaltis TaxID=2495887 RepID=UPI00110C6C61|nr:hypothetical protein [Nonomuraea basaltis]TMS00208.1 hypothetical protein EJK15_03795 [Nonomuraea basaltis]
MTFKPADAPDHTMTWVDGTPTVTYGCMCRPQCRHQVSVAGVTTIGGALHATASAGIHQH